MIKMMVLLLADVAGRDGGEYEYDLISSNIVRIKGMITRLGNFNPTLA